VSVGVGGLSGSSSNADVEAYLFARLVREHGADLTGTAASALLTISDGSRYVLSLELPSGAKPLHEGAPLSDEADVQWRLDWCALPNEPRTAFATVLSGVRNGTLLTVAPSATWFPLPPTAAAAAAAAEDTAEAVRAAAAAAAIAAAKPKKGAKKGKAPAAPPPPDPEAEARAAEETTAAVVAALASAASGGARPSGVRCNVLKLRLRKNPSAAGAATTIQCSYRGLLARRAVALIKVLNLRRTNVAASAFSSNVAGLRSKLAARRLSTDKIDALRRAARTSGEREPSAAATPKVPQDASKPNLRIDTTELR
jgi:hypothetical protein